MTPNQVATSVPDFKSAQSAIEKAFSLGKCLKCGCLKETSEDILASISKECAAQDVESLRSFTSERISDMRTIEYDCLGCKVCHPAVAANALGDILKKGDSCAVAERAQENQSWPRVAGDFKVINVAARVAVCTLNSLDLYREISESPFPGLAIVGRLATENIGIEKIVLNLIANPNIRFLIVIGDETETKIGHHAGQTLKSLAENGVDDGMRVVGSIGKRPVLKNLTRTHIQQFRQQVEIVPLLGVTRLGTFERKLDELNDRPLSPLLAAASSQGSDRNEFQATEPTVLRLDPKGYFIVIPDIARREIVCEHYTNQGKQMAVIRGVSSQSIFNTVTDLDLISRLDHAAYLGRELALAELAFTENRPYVQDRAPGETGESASGKCVPGVCC